MSIQEARARRDLAAALLAAAPDPDRAWNAYHRNAEFHARVDLMVGLWVDLVPALIESAEHAAAAMEIGMGRRLFQREFPPPEPHYLLVWQVPGYSVGGEDRIRAEVEHPETCTVRAADCPIETASRNIEDNQRHELGHFRVDGLHPDGGLVLTAVDR